VFVILREDRPKRFLSNAQTPKVEGLVRLRLAAQIRKTTEVRKTAKRAKMAANALGEKQ
jgi:hypothetical protein